MDDEDVKEKIVDTVRELAKTGNSKAKVALTLLTLFGGGNGQNWTRLDSNTGSEDIKCNKTNQNRNRYGQGETYGN